MRTTDPLAAITALLESSDPDTVIQYDGTTYRVAPSESKREGFFEILTKKQTDEKAQHEEYKSLLAILSGAQKCFNPIERVAGWMQSESETWLRSARYNESLRATDSDQVHPTD